MTAPQRVIDRVLSHVTLSPGGCLTTTYALNASHYGVIGWKEGGRSLSAYVHRVAWESAHGPIPDGLTIDHVRCRNTGCVNVEHMRLITSVDNSRRNHGADFPLGQSCRRNHPLTSRRKVGNGRIRGRQVFAYRCRDCELERRKESSRA